MNEEIDVELRVKTFRDLDFTVLAYVYEYRVEYKIYDVVGYNLDNSPEYQKSGSTASPDPVPKITESEVYAHGSVKWDGCSNWYFDEQDKCMLHGCNKKDVVRLGLILGECWDWTSELLEHFDGE